MASRLLFEVLRGQWFLDLSNISGYQPLVNKIISGEMIYEKREAQSVMSFMTETGESVDPTKQFSGYAQIELIGEMTRYGNECTYGAEDYVRMLDAANDNSNVRGTILKTDGPGGAVGAINPFIDFKKRKRKPVVGLANTAASLHYWLLTEVCDYILAENTVSAKFGSVGVMCTLLDVRGAYKKEGYELHEIYGPESEQHKNLAFRLALEGKYDMIKSEELSPLEQKFQGSVKSNRPNLKIETGVLTGKTFFAEKAKELGMIDGIGGHKEAMEMIDMLNEVKYKSK